MLTGVLVALLTLSLLGLPALPAAAQPSLTWTAGAVGGGWYAISGGMAELIREKAGLNIKVIPGVSARSLVGTLSRRGVVTRAGAPPPHPRRLFPHPDAGAPEPHPPRSRWVTHGQGTTGTGTGTDASAGRTPQFQHRLDRGTGQEDEAGGQLERGVS